MPHPRRAALLRAAVASLVMTGAACAHARAALAFEVLPRPVPERRSHAAAWACLAAGAGLVGASFPLADAADRRYDEYRRETDLGAIENRWNATVRADRLASGSLLAGEVLLATGVWLRFVHRPDARRVALDLGPGRCALSCSF
jgi:hypothetical protein